MVAVAGLMVPEGPGNRTGVVGGRVVAEGKIVSAPIRFASSATAAVGGNWISAAEPVASPRYLPGNHIFSRLVETEIPERKLVTEISDADVLGRTRTKTLLGHVARRIWGRASGPVRSILRPATTTVRRLAYQVWK